MPSNKIQYTLGISADTSQAKKQIADLYKSLQGVEKLNLDLSGLDADVVKAAEAADKLTSHLRAAVNVDTGKLNLIKLNQSIKESGDSLSTLVNNLSYGGQIGQQAFEQLATAISKTEVPLKTMNATLSSALTTLQNTIKWQLSSNIVHGLQGAFSGAVSYAQDLNKTLTDIRIVTGMSVDDMAKFADNANKAAKELSATTKAYADASLIYYQQGDSAELAAKKAATTIKAANVAFTASAKEMSEMLTAVWNSYQVGADQLESVVDVMANLGAKTASSMEEMATAMQKVASTANTVGVSMQQMSAIVATSASVTRQAPETIGTAWNTILSRIGGLKLGNTLEDGVDLNKYSSALATVGVNILDATGELREMGGVIDELGAKWQTLSSGQKAALAQTIGGARQYTQIMAFFENFDKYQQNMGFANNSQGALQQQQEIYAQGWEAASKRVRAAMEGIYSGLIDDQAIIKATNNIASIVNGLSSFIKTLGGAKGVVSAFGSVLLSVFSDRLGAQLKNIGNEVKNIFVDPKKQFETAYNEMRDEIQMNADATNSTSMSYQLDLLDVKKELLAKEQYLSDAQKATINNAIEGYTNQINKLHELETALNDVTKMNENHEKAFNNVLQSAVTNGIIDQQKQSQLSTTYDITKNNLLVSNIADYFPDITELNKFGDNLEAKIQSITGTFESLKTAVASSGEQTWIDALNKFDLKNLDDTKLKSLVQTIQQIGKEASQTGEHELQSLRQQIDALPDGTQKQTLIALFNDLREQLNSAAQASINFNQANAKTENTLDKLKQKLQSFPTTFNKIVEGVSKAGSAMLALSRVSASFNNATVTMRDSTAKLSDRLGALGSAATSAGMAFATLKQALTFLSVSNPIAMGISLAATAAMAISSGISGWQEADQQDREEKAKKSSELANALSEEDENVQNLYTTYYELETARKKSGEVTDEYLNALDELLKSLGLERDSVIEDANAYDQLAENISKANQARNKDNQKKYQQAFEDSISALPSKNIKGQGNIVVGNKADEEILTTLGFSKIKSNPIGGEILPNSYQTDYLATLQPLEMAKLAVSSLTDKQKNKLVESYLNSIGLTSNRNEQSVRDLAGNMHTYSELLSQASIYPEISKMGENIPFEELIENYNRLFYDGTEFIQSDTIQSGLAFTQEDIDNYLLGYFQSNLNAAFSQIQESGILLNSEELKHYADELQLMRTANAEKVADFVFPDRDDINGWMDLALNYDYTKSHNYSNISQKSRNAVDTVLGPVISDDIISNARMMALKNVETAIERQASNISDYDQLNEVIKTTLGFTSDESPIWLEDLILKPIMKELPVLLNNNNIVETINNGYQEYQNQKASLDWGKMGFRADISDKDVAASYAAIYGFSDSEKLIEQANLLQTDALIARGASSVKDLTALRDKYGLNDKEYTDDIFGLHSLQEDLFTVIQSQIDDLGIDENIKTSYLNGIQNMIRSLKMSFQQIYVDEVINSSKDFDQNQKGQLKNGFKTWKWEDFNQASQIINSFSEVGVKPTDLSDLDRESAIKKGLLDKEGKWTDLAKAYSILLDVPFLQLQKHIESLEPQVVNTSEKINEIIDGYIKPDAATIFSLKQNPSSWKLEDYTAFTQQALAAGIDETRIKGYVNANSLEQQKVWADLLAAGIEQGKTDKIDSQQIELWQAQLKALNNSIDTTEFQNKIKPYQEALSALSSEIQNIVSGKGLSQKSQDILQRVGIDPSKIKDIKSYTQALTELRNKLQSEFQTQLTAYGKPFNPYLSQEEIDAMSEDKQAAYNRLLQLREDINNTNEAILSSYATAQQEYTNEVQASIKNMEAAYNRAAEQNERLQTKAETAVQSIGKSISEIQASQMGLNSATEWSSKTVAEQTQFATQALNDAYTAQSNLLGQQMQDWQSLLSVINDSGKGINQALATVGDSTNVWARDGKNSFMAGLRGMFDESQMRALSQAWDKASQKLDFSKMSDKQIWEAIKREAGDALADVGTDLDKLTAQYKDDVNDIGKTIAEQLQQDADQTVAIWEQAFNTIAGLRKKLFSGENITEDLANDIDAYLLALKSSGLNNEEFQRQVLSGELKGDTLKTPIVTTKQLYDKYGLSMFDTGANAEESLKNFRTNVRQEANAQGVFSYSQIQEIERSELQRLLKSSQASTGYTDTEINSLVDKYLSGDKEAAAQILEAAQIMKQAADGQLNLMEANRQQQEQDAAFQNGIENLGNKNGKFVDQQEQQQKDLDLLNKARDKFDKDTHGLNEKDFSPEEIQRLQDLTGTAFDNIKLDQLNNASDGAAQELYKLAQAAAAAAQAEAEKAGYMQFDGEWHNTLSEGLSEEDYYDIQSDKQSLYTKADDGLYYLKGQKAEGIKDTLKGFEDTAESASINQAENEAKNFDKLAQSVDMSREEFEDYIKTQKELGNIIGETDKELAQNAALLARQTKGFDEAQKNMSDYMKTLNKTTKGSNEHSKTLNKVRGIYADLFDLTDKEASHLSNSFLESTENAKLLEKAMQGDEKAWDKLTAAASKDIFSQIDTSQMFDPQNVLSDVDGFISSIQDYINNTPLSIGDNLDTAPFYNALHDMVFASEETATEVSAALSNIGVEAKLVPNEAPLGEGEAQISPSGSLLVPIVNPDGTLEYKEVAPQGSYTISADGGVAKYWTIEGATYNGRGVTNGGASSPKKSGGGGGGGKQHKKKDPIRPKDEIERYHEVRDQLDQLSHHLDRIDKLKTRAYGGKHLDALREEIALLKQENGLQQEYYAEAARYLAADRADLMHYGAATFNADGTVNYEEYMQNIIAEVNRRFAASESDEEDKAAQQWYDDAKKALENYEEALDLVDTTQNDILDNLNEISALTLEAAQYRLEIRVDLNDSDIEILDYYISKWEKMLSQQDESMEASIGQVYKYEDSLSALGDTFSELIYAHNMGDLNDSDFVEGLKDVRDQIFDTLGSINDLQNTIAEWYGQTLDKAEEELDKYTSKISHSRDVMQTYIEMQQLMGKGADYRALQNMYTFAYESSLENAKAAREYVDILKEAREVILQQVEEYGWTDTLKQQFDDVEAHIIEAENTLLENTQQTLEDAKAEFENTISAIIKEVDNVFTALKDANGDLKSSFSEVADEYSFWTEQQGWYVSTAKELYEVSKINRKIEDSIAGATTQQSKERLKLLQDEINAYAEKNRLTEYDIKMNELQYEMALAMQGLEDAGNNKQTVRLTRDENGNYGYQYTADQDEMDAARQKYEDVLQQINELSDEYQKEVAQKWIDAEQQFWEKVQEISQDTTLTVEERQRRIEELTAQHLETMQYYHDEYNKASEQLLTNQGYIQEHYGETIIANTGMVQDQLNATISMMIGDTERYMTHITEEALPAISDAMEIYKGDLDATKEATKLSWEAMGDSVQAYRGINQLARQDIQNTDQVLRNTLSGISNATAKWLEHSNSLRTTITSYESLGNSINGIISKLNSVTSAANTAASAIRNMQSASYSSYSGGGSSSGSGNGSGNNGSGNKSKSSSSSSSDYYYYNKQGTKVSSPSRTIDSATSAWNDALKKHYSAAEGGLDDLTGWHYLHGTLQRPELVLNADDTQNMLKMVNILHNLSPEMLSALHGTINGSAYTMLAGLGGAMSAHSINSTNSELNQNVEIHADFPNVTDKNEIVEAFDNLVNLATQYANRKG